MTTELTVERLREVLDYDPETGLFHWRVRLAHRIHIGDVAGVIMNTGHRKINIDGKPYLASRLAWLYMHGKWPKHEIDHKDRSPGNDVFENLREATHAENSRNRGAHRDSKQKFLGVEKHHTGRYAARICVDGKRYWLGLFYTPEAAAKRYDEHARNFFGEFASTNFGDGH